MYLHEDRHVLPGTILGYLSAFNATVQMSTEVNWTADPSVRCLISAFRQAHLGSRKIPLDWDLAAVLKEFSKPPFEPMRTAGFKFVTYKALFLFALASIKRRGEIHACVWDTAKFSKDNVFTVHLDPTFVFKNAAHLRDRTAAAVIPFTGLRHRVSDPSELSLCPVRAMRIYMDRARPLRGLALRRLFGLVQLLSSGTADDHVERHHPG